MTIRGELADEKHIVLFFTDNGADIAPDRLEQIRRRLAGSISELDETEGGIGLKNINDRIRLEYGPEYEIRLFSGTEAIISDIRMLETSGLEMIESLRMAGSQAKVIIVSGYSEFEYAKTAIRLGVHSYILKPIEEIELEEAIRTATAELEKERQRFKALEEREGAADENEAGDELPLGKAGLIDEVKKYIAAHFREDITLVHLAEHFFINPYYLSQLFKRKTGETYLSFITKTRIDKSKELLAATDLKIYEICYEVGYESVKYFSKIFERHTGLRPSEYRARRGI